MRTRAVQESAASTQNLPGSAGEDLVAALSRKVIGQSAAMTAIAPYVQMHRAGLAPEGRPVGVFLLLGPTGTGKTRTVEVLAEALHGSEKKLLRIDCGEFQMDHEVAKLIGAPPGYLGHRETHPLLTQQKLNAAASERCSLTLVLFDEIEKAAPSLTRLLLGILDRAVLTLGDNTAVNFERSLIFLTSNLGARAMMRELGPSFGFPGVSTQPPEELSRRLDNLALAAARKQFSPEFLNRVDAIITYRPLSSECLTEILDLQLAELQAHVDARLGARSFRIEVEPEGRQFLLNRGTSAEYGARELKRTLQRHLTHPLAALVAAGDVEPGSTLRVQADPAGQHLIFACETNPPGEAGSPAPAEPCDSHPAAAPRRRSMRAGWRIGSAESA